MEKTNNIDDLKAIKSTYLDRIARPRHIIHLKMIN